MHAKRVLSYLLVLITVAAAGIVFLTGFAVSDMYAPVQEGPCQGVTLFSLVDGVPSTSEILMREVPVGTKCLVKRPYGYVEAYPDDHNNISVIASALGRGSDGMAYVTGKIRNLDNERIDCIVVTFTLFDSQGNQVGNAYATLDYLEAQGTWLFKTDPVPIEDVAFNRFASVFTGSYSGQ